MKSKQLAPTEDAPKASGYRKFLATVQMQEGMLCCEIVESGGTDAVNINPYLYAILGFSEDGTERKKDRPAGTLEAYCARLSSWFKQSGGLAGGVETPVLVGMLWRNTDGVGIGLDVRIPEPTADVTDIPRSNVKPARVPKTKTKKVKLP